MYYFIVGSQMQVIIRAAMTLMATVPMIALGSSSGPVSNGLSHEAGLQVFEVGLLALTQ